MNQLGPKTKKNMENAFAGESMARNKYTYYASIADKAGYKQIAKLFLETADNEKEHAKVWAKQLGVLKELKEVLQEAIDGEHYEHTEMYPAMAKEAEEEGHSDIAELFRKTAQVEIGHENRYKKLLNNLKDQKVFKREEEVKWKCGNCGYIYTGSEAPELCPSCSHPQAYFEFFVENY